MGLKKNLINIENIVMIKHLWVIHILVLNKSWEFDGPLKNQTQPYLILFFSSFLIERSRGVDDLNCIKNGISEWSLNTGCESHHSLYTNALVKNMSPLLSPIRCKLWNSLSLLALLGTPTLVVGSYNGLIKNHNFFGSSFSPTHFLFPSLSFCVSLRKKDL